MTNTTQHITYIHQPQANDLAKNMNHTTKTAILKCFDDQHDLNKCLDSILP